MIQASTNGSTGLDVYGFPVPDDEAIRAARARCSDAAEAVRPKWTKLRQQLANNQAREDKIKKYCRKVMLCGQNSLLHRCSSSQGSLPRWSSHAHASPGHLASFVTPAQDPLLFPFQALTL